VRAVLEDRLAAIAAELAKWRHLHEAAEPHLTRIESMGFSHTLLRLEAELAWHEEALKTLPAAFDQRAEPR
jgi:hypothetical protein